jgi:hypothetical protein
MDSSFNDFDNLTDEEIHPPFDEEIRPPDDIKREKLIQDTRSEFDREMEEALYLSMQEVREEEIKNHKFEEEIFNNYIKEQNERRELFRDLLINMNKLSRFDKDIKELYDFLDPIIEAYCNHYITRYELDKETHDKIFKVLKTIRVNKNTLDILQTIIVKNS